VARRKNAVPRQVVTEPGTRTRLPPGPPPTTRPRPVKLTISIPAERAEEWRDAVFYLRTLGEPATLTGLIVEGVELYLEGLRQQTDTPIPSRGARNLTPGRLSR
jgi:hypothetical protein